MIQRPPNERLDLPGGWPTTRRHPRTAADAFPDVRAACVSLPPRRFIPRAGTVFGIVVLVALSAFLGLVLVEFLTPCDVATFASP